MFNMETFAYDVARIVQAFMLGGILLLILAFTSKGIGKWGKYLKFLIIAAGVISIEILLFLTMYKEAFHWSYDIATGEAVDHYSTHSSCMAMAMIALVCNVIAFFVQYRKRQNNENPDDYKRRRL